MKKLKRVAIVFTMALSVQYIAPIVVVVPNRREHPEALRGPRISSEPYISGDTFRVACDFVIDEQKAPVDTAHIKHGDTVFLNADFLEFFFTHVHPFIEHPYILVTHNSDHPAPGRFAQFLEDEKIIAWFGQNCSVIHHPKFFPIPIGLANRYWNHGSIETFNQMIALEQPKRNILLYLNFAQNTNPIRKAVQSFFQNKSFCYKASRKPHGDYLKDFTRTKFVVSPEGNGLDCHRPWEAMLMGAIPVMKHSTLDPLFEGLPVILVHDWSEVTQEFLQQEYAKIHQQTFNLERLFAPYWLDKINQVKTKAKASLN